MKHKCTRCGSSESMFFFPMADGCGRNMDGPQAAIGGTYFELCDSCRIQFIHFMEDADSRVLFHVKKEDCE